MHLSVANILYLLCKGVLQTMEVLWLMYFLYDFGCKMFSLSTEWGEVCP